MKTQLRTLEELAKLNKDKSTWVRKAWAEMMRIISEVEVDEIFEVKMCAATENMQFDNYLRLGEEDLMIDYGGGQGLSAREGEFLNLRTWNVFSIGMIKECLCELPETIESMKKLIEIANKNTEKLEIIYSKFSEIEK